MCVPGRQQQMQVDRVGSGPLARMGERVRIQLVRGSVEEEESNVDVLRQLGADHWLSCESTMEAGKEVAARTGRPRAGYQQR